MQKISQKNEGVTLIALIITIIVLLVIISITLKFSENSLLEAKDNKIESELSLLQGAIIQKYAIIKTENKDGKVATQITGNTTLASDPERPKELVGIRLASTNTLTSNGFDNFLIDYENTENMTYEQYYYWLEEEDMKTLGITNDSTTAEKNYKYRYIVNYSTGEVFDVGNKKYYMTEAPVYLEGSNSKINETTYNFTD